MLDGELVFHGGGVCRRCKEDRVLDRIVIPAES